MVHKVDLRIDKAATVLSICTNFINLTFNREAIDLDH